MKRIFAIYRKELIDTLRDRKTLTFMLLVPLLATPGLVIGATWLVEEMLKKQEAETFVVAATPASRDAYVKCVHDWFCSTNIAKAFRLADTPFMKALLESQQEDLVVEAPAELLADPEAFYRWTKVLAERVRVGLDLPREQLEGPILELPRRMQDQLVEFYQVAVKGLGLIEFVEPSSLVEPPLKAAEKIAGRVVPDELADEEFMPRLIWAIEEKEIEGFLRMPPQLAELDQFEQEQLEIVFLYDSTVSLSEKAFDRFEQAMEIMGRQVAVRRLEARGLNEKFLEPLVMREETNLATKTEILLSLLSGIVPGIIIIYAFLGGMYPAIDLGAGEKERNTLETLLLSPANRTEIALGKFLVILTTSIITALLGITAVGISFKYVLPPALSELLNVMIQPKVIGLLVMLIVPLSVIFSGMLLAISIYARSFKEAQNYLAPLQLIVMLPAAVVLLPGVEMDWRLAQAPLLNVVLLSRDCLKGDFHWPFIAMTMLSSTILAAVCVAFAVRQFNREEVLFRS
jgi:sodium transport system permease protein